MTVKNTTTNRKILTDFSPEMNNGNDCQTLCGYSCVLHHFNLTLSFKWIANWITKSISFLIILHLNSSIERKTKSLCWNCLFQWLKFGFIPKFGFTPHLKTIQVACWECICTKCNPCSKHFEFVFACPRFRESVILLFDTTIIAWQCSSPQPKNAMVLKPAANRSPCNLTCSILGEIKQPPKTVTLFQSSRSSFWRQGKGLIKPSC